MATPERAKELTALAVDLASLTLSPDQLCDLELLLNGAFAPLAGYHARADYESVLELQRLGSGRPWPLPICLDVDASVRARLEPGALLALRDQEGFMLAVLNVEDIWRPDPRREARLVYGTDDPGAHPGVDKFLAATGEFYLGGRVEGLHAPFHFDYRELRLAPGAARGLFARKGWSKALGFTCSRAPQCADERMLLDAAGRAGAKILLFSPVSQSLLGNPEHFTRVRCCKRFIERFPGDLAALVLAPLRVRAAGPRQALLEAIVHANYGCTHTLIDERRLDPFGESGQIPFYAPGETLAAMAGPAREIGIAPVSPEQEAYPEETFLGAAALKRRLDFDEPVPARCLLPEIEAELRRAYPPRSGQGFTVFITGLSGAGKSTLAKLLYVKFMELGDRPVSLLDGDIVRKNLSSELTFSQEHRFLNIKRIGFVAGEITKNRGIAICAPIAPYRDARRAAREQVEAYGGFIEVYLSTPLAVCERRDRKGIYAKARAGKMTGVTGIDAPYEPPQAAEIVLDTTACDVIETARRVIDYLAENRYLA
ncbi:MAG: adenylyl-sulfate kinase [Desulfovibrionaceae bacterium]|nr:adenylyl-sulfate kinase [Desulfovibrionaceae bacterium]